MGPEMDGAKEILGEIKKYWERQRNIGGNNQKFQHAYWEDKGSTDPSLGNLTNNWQSHWWWIVNANALEYQGIILKKEKKLCEFFS